MTKDKQLLKDFLEKDDLNSLYYLIFEVNGTHLRKVISKMLGSCREVKVDECLLDFYDDLTKPTDQGEKKLSNFDFNEELTPYLKQAVRHYIMDGFRKRQKKTEMEEDVTDFATLKIEDEDMPDYSDCFYSLLKSLSECKSISVRDQYIMLTYLLSKVGNNEMTELEINKAIAEQLDLSEASVKKARQRAVDKLKSTMDVKF